MLDAKLVLLFLFDILNFFVVLCIMDDFIIMLPYKMIFATEII